MTVVLDKELETLVGRLVASGRFPTPHEAVGAGLRKLEGEEAVPSAFECFPEGSLAKFFTPENNSEQRELFKACSMAVVPGGVSFYSPAPSPTDKSVGYFLSPSGLGN